MIGIAIIDVTGVVSIISIISIISMVIKSNQPGEALVSGEQLPAVWPLRQQL